MSPREIVETRRRFLSRLTIGLTALMGALVGVPIVGYLVAPLFRPPPSQFVAVGAVGDFPLGQTTLVHFRDPSPPDSWRRPRCGCAVAPSTDPRPSRCSRSTARISAVP